MGPPGPSGLLLGEAPGPGQRCLLSVVFVHASPDSPHRGGSHFKPLAEQSSGPPPAAHFPSCVPVCSTPTHPIPALPLGFSLWPQNLQK